VNLTPVVIHYTDWVTLYPILTKELHKSCSALWYWAYSPAVWDLITFWWMSDLMKRHSSGNFLISGFKVVPITVVIRDSQPIKGMKINFADFFFCFPSDRQRLKSWRLCFTFCILFFSCRETNEGIRKRQKKNYLFFCGNSMCDIWELYHVVQQNSHRWYMLHSYIREIFGNN